MLCVLGCERERAPVPSPCEVLAAEYAAALAAAPKACTEDSDCKSFVAIPSLEVSPSGEGLMGQRPATTCSGEAIAADVAPFRRLMERARQMGCGHIAPGVPGGNQRCDDYAWSAICNESKRCQAHTTSGF